MNLAKTTLQTWHPPTLETFEKMINGDFGQSALLAVGMGVAKYVNSSFNPFSEAKSPINRMLSAVGNGATGTMIGTLGEALVFPTKYNPDGGVAGGQGQSMTLYPREGALGWNTNVEAPQRDHLVKPPRSGGQPA